MLDYCDTALRPGSNCLGASPVNPIYHYQYDALGRVAEIENHYLEAELYKPEVKITYSYDQLGNRKSLHLSGLDTIIQFSYEYNQMDQLMSISDANLQGHTIGLSFAPSGRMTQIRHINGTHSEFSYSSSTGQLSGISHLKSDNSEILNLAYSYDARNNITQKIIDGIATDYSYDLKDQLIGVRINGVETERYTYDGVGNRLTSLEANNWSYNPGNQLLSYDGHSFGYDDNGNMTQMQSPGASENLTYSVDDGLINYQKGATEASYFYDYSELRVKKVANGQRTYFIYDGSVMLAEMSFNSSNQVTDQRYYVFRPNKYYPLAMVVKNSENYNIYSYHHDHLMTPVILTDENEIKVWEGDYKSYGELTKKIENTVNNFRFQGQFEDWESGFYYNMNRYLIPHLGRYSRLDPLGTYNHRIYIYGMNNPVNNLDPWGLVCIPYWQSWEYAWTREGTPYWKGQGRPASQAVIYGIWADCYWYKVQDRARVYKVITYYICIELVEKKCPPSHELKVTTRQTEYYRSKPLPEKIIEVKHTRAIWNADGYVCDPNFSWP